eukprot:4264826-Amphidinium_carterae.2
MGSSWSSSCALELPAAWKRTFIRTFVYAESALAAAATRTNTVLPQPSKKGGLVASKESAKM